MASLTSLISFAGLQHAHRLPQTPSGVQFGQWLDAFNSANEATLRAYHEAYFPYHAVSSREIGTSTRELMLSKLTGGFEVEYVEDFTENSLTAIVREKGHRKFASMTVHVTVSPPHMITRLEIHRIGTPDRFLLPEEREARTLDAAKRTGLVSQAATKIEENYVTKSVAEKMASSLRQKLTAGEYESTNDILELANVLMSDINDVYLDKHMSIGFIWPPPDNKREEVPESEMLERLRLKNFGFGSISQYSHGIMGIEINEFVLSSIDEARHEIAKRMSAIADAKALIIDLRENGGGDPSMVALIASYLFGNANVHLNDMYDPRSSETVEFWTDPHVQGDKFGPSKPIYVLTSGRTISGGEELAYDLQALKRATLFGEITAGAANPRTPFVIDPGFIAMIPSQCPINPVTGTNWEGIGVVPDVEISWADAFDAAYKKAKEDLGVDDRSGDDGKEKAEQKILDGGRQEMEDL